MYFELLNKDIRKVAGTFKQVYSQDNKIYIQSDEELPEPFKKVENLPEEFFLKQEQEKKEAIRAKTEEFNQLAQERLKSFSSDALGSTHIYNSSIEDQLNLMGLIIAKVDSFFRCKEDTQGAIFENKIHTKEQLKKVYSDGLAYKSNVLSICGILKAHILNLDNIDQIKNTTWKDGQELLAKHLQEQAHNVKFK